MSKKKLYNVNIDSYNNYMTEFNRTVNDRPVINTNIDRALKYDFTLKPSGYDAWEWTKDAYTTWQQNKNETNLNTSLGKMDRLFKDENVLLNAEQYMINDLEIKDLLSNIQSDTDNALVYYRQLNKLLQENAELKEDYDRIQRGELEFQQNSPSKELLNSDLKDLAFERKLLEESKESIQKDIDYYQDKVNRVNEGWWINTHKVSNYYKGKELSLDIDFFNIDTYLYKVPGLLGSSASSMKSNTLSTISGAVAARFASKGVVIPAAIAGLVSIGANLYSRSEESHAELHENYKEKVRRYSLKDGSYDAAIKNAERQLNAQGIKPTNEDEVFNAILSGKVHSGSEKFDKNAIDAMTGLEKLYTDNMALAGWDIAQTAIEVSPIGSVGKLVKGTANLAKKIKGIGKQIDKASEFTTNLSDKISEAIEFGIDNISLLPKYNIGKRITNIGGRIALSSMTEGIEEGTQYIRGLEFINSSEFKENPTIFDSMIGNLEIGARSVFAALTPFDPIYSSDKEFIENFKSGALLGGLMSSVITPLSQYKPIKNKYRADEFVSSLFADGMQNKDEVSKNELYVKAAKSDNWNDIEDSFNELLLMNIDGISQEDVRLERTRAQKLKNKALSPITLSRAHELEIDPKSDDFNKFVALWQYHEDKYNESTKQLRTVNELIASLLNTEEYVNEVDNKKQIHDIFSSALINKTRLELLESIKSEYQKIIDDFQKLENNEIPTNIKTVLRYIEVVDKLIDDAKKDYYSQLKDNDLKDSDIAVSSIYKDLGDAIKKQLYLTIDHNLNIEDYNSLTTGSKKSVKSRLNKYTQVVNDNYDLQEQLQNKVRNILEESQEDVDISEELDNIVTEESETTVEQKTETVNTTEDGTKEEPEIKPIKEEQSQTVESEKSVEKQEIENPEITKLRDEILSKRNETVMVGTKKVVKSRSSINKEKIRLALSKIEDWDNKTPTQRHIEAEQIAHEDNTYSIDELSEQPEHIFSNNLFGKTYKLAELKLQQLGETIAPKIAEEIKQKSQNYSGYSFDGEKQGQGLRTAILKAISRLEERLGNGDRRAGRSKLRDVPGQQAINNLLLQDIPSGGIATYYEDLVRAVKGTPYEALLDNIRVENVKSAVWKYFDKNGNFNYQYNEEFLSTDIEASDIYDEDTENFLKLRNLKQRLEEAIFDGNTEEANRLVDLINTKLKEIESDENNTIQEEVKEERVKEINSYDDRKQEVIAAKEPEIVITEDGSLIDVTYDNTVDTYSHNLDYYKYNSQEEARAFAEVSANEDFITNSEITFNVKDDDIQVIFKYEGKEYVSKILTEQDLRNNRNFSRLKSANLLIIISNLNRFRNKIKLLAKQSELTGKKLIPLGIARTNGIIRNLKDKDGNPINRNLQNTPLWKLSSVYDITPSNTLIGISTGSIRNAQVRRGTDLWTSKGTSMGAAIWHIDVEHPETGNTKPLDILLNNKSFKGNKTVSKLVLDLLLSNDLYYTTKEDVRTPFTPELLLNLIVNHGEHTIVKEKEAAKLSQDQISAKKAKQLYLNNGNLIVGSKIYAVSDIIGNPEVYNEITDYIENNMHWNINEDLLWQYFGGIDTTNSKHPLYNLVGWFKRTKSEKLTIIPEELEFTRKDVGLDSEVPNGISMLGWYIKNNIIQTDFDKLTDANIYILDVALEDTEVKQHIEQATQQVTEELNKPEEEQELTLDSFFAMLGPSDDASANYTNTELFGETQTIDKNAATKWLKKTLGLTNEQIVFSDTVLEITKAGLSVMGQAKIDSIALYDLAPEGVEFHEAWHRVSNLLISEKRRNNIYNRYRKKNNLKESKDITIDELMAEEFRKFMLDNQYKFDFESLNWFRKIANFIKMWYKVGDITLAKIYYNINVGKYSKVRPSKQNIERFRQLYSNAAPFEIRGQKFSTISSVSQYNDFLNSLIFVLLNTLNINEYTDVEKLDLRILKKMLVNKEGKAKNQAWQEIYLNFDTVVAKDLRSKLGKLLIKLVNKERDQKTSDLDAGETNKINVGEHTIASYETSLYDNAPAEVKFFFQTIPSHIYNSEGKKVLEVNPTTGIPKFVDSKKTWNTVLNDLHTVSNIGELIDRVNKLALNNLLYSGVKAKLDSLITKSKSSDKKQAVDAEVLLTKLITVIRSHKHRFTTGKITSTENGNIVDIIDNTVDIKSKVYPSIWSQYLFNDGGVFTHNKEGHVIFTKEGKNKLNTFIKQYDAMMWAFEHNGITRKGTDIKSGAALEQAKQFTADLFNSIGILIDKGTIELLLDRTAYGNSEELVYNKLRKLYNSSIFYGGLPNLIDLLKSVSSQEKNGTINIFEHNGKEIRPINLFTNNGFVKELAKAYVEYHANSEELRSLGALGNLYYPISLNNFASDRVNELNKNLELVGKLHKVKYNGGSRILELLKNPNTKLELETFVNFRTSDNSDQGRDYFGITDKEDYIAKMSMVLKDRILFPTVADKKTYHTITGVTLPHERLSFINAKYGIGEIVGFGEGVINQFMEYVFAEKDAIEFVMEQVDDRVDENGEYISKNRIPKSERIKNFHTPNKYKDKNGKTHKIESNGTRFRFLTGIYKLVEKKNSKGEKFYEKEFVSFNDPKKSSKLNLDTAYKEFFGDHISDNQRSWMISTLLQERVKKEIQKAIDLGIINSITTTNETYGLTNNLLDIREIEERAKYYRKNDRLRTNAEAYAIYDLIADYTVNSIISINEIELLFSGDPAYYKWIYDENGVIDISIDKIKRLGALTSTGTNNRLDFEDMLYTTYTAAELNDYEIGDKLYDTILNLFTRGNVISLVKQMLGTQALFDENGNEYTIEQLRELYPEQARLAEIRAKQLAGYDEGINVADAAVYVSPDMYRKMMRLIGEWSSEIEEAFNILTDPKTEDLWQSDPETYSKMLEISLKPLKYMAFGTRFEHGLNVPYFNKMALFPLFKSIATGDIKALYDRMTDSNNPLDMVLFNSAVKAGSKSPMDYYDENGNINDLNKLVVYNQDFKYLRQQLNTDPHTHEEQMAGTLMLKVGISNLGMNEYYGLPDSKVTGLEIKQTIFDCMNALSDKGLEKIKNDLFDADGNVSIEKITKVLQEEAEGQDANDNIISGLTLVNGKPMLPISALSDNKWLESIFISYINKRTIDIELPGGAFIQRSVFGLEATQMSVITDNMLGDGLHLNLINSIFSEVERLHSKDALFNSNTQKEYTEQELINLYPELWEKVKKFDGSMDSIISINLLKHIIPSYHKMTFKQARQWLIDNGVIGRNAEPLAIGYRIPTQSQASVSALRFVDVFPELMGDTIVLPEAFTKLTGSDFDQVRLK